MEAIDRLSETLDKQIEATIKEMIGETKKN